MAAMMLLRTESPNILAAVPSPIIRASSSQNYPSLAGECDCSDYLITHRIRIPHYPSLALADAIADGAPAALDERHLRLKAWPRISAWLCNYVLRAPTDGVMMMMMMMRREIGV